MAPKLTETTNDKMAQRKGGDTPIPIIPRITEAHEPLRTGEGCETITINPPQTPLQIAPEPAPKKEPAPLKIALVGTAPSSRHLAPYGDHSWKIWACSAGNMNAVPRVDAWFEIHSNLLWPEHEHFGRPYIEWLRAQSFPIYMQDNSLVPRAIPLPKDELVDKFGPFFFTSSFAWMLAMAMREGAKEIALFGIDMASRDEYILQRPGAYYFFREAQRLGVKITAPFESDIMQPPALYGYSDGTPFGRKMAVREKELKDRVASMKQQRDQLTNNITYLEGAIENMDYMKNIWGGVNG